MLSTIFDSLTLGNYIQLDEQGNEIIPFGTAKIAVVNGRWTFNNKFMMNCKTPVQQVVSGFIKGCIFGMPMDITIKRRSYSVIATRETFYANGNLKQYNYIFPPTRLDHKAINEMEFEKVA